MLTKLPIMQQHKLELIQAPRQKYLMRCIINKGPTKTLQEKIDEELSLRLQHRLKQGLFQTLLPFNGLSARQIGNKSMLQNTVKLTTPCWTRCIK
jgi:hypothetical protein